MRFKSFNPFSSRLFQGVAVLALSATLAGCSGNVTRFTDSLFTGSTAPKQAVASRPMVPEQQMPPLVAPVESALLPPPAQSGDDTPGAPLPSSQHAAATLGAPPRNLGTLPVDEATWPSPAASESVRETKTYIVQSGDTLSLIAAKTGNRVTHLKQANGLETDMIRVGQKLVVPATNTRVLNAENAPVQMASVQAGQRHETPVPIKKAAARTQAVSVKTAEVVVPEASSNNNVTAKTPMMTASQETGADSAKSAGSVPGTATHRVSQKQSNEGQQVAAIAPQATGIAQLRWPARGRILSSYGEREGTATNDGLDIMVPEGTSIKAAENGVVIYAGDGLKEFGKTVLIRHEDNLVTVYGHNNTVLVQRGQQVRRGDEIAKSGMSGNATSPKLHFEVRKNSSPVNPMKYLEQ